MRPSARAWAPRDASWSSAGTRWRERSTAISTSTAGWSRFPRELPAGGLPDPAVDRARRLPGRPDAARRAAARLPQAAPLHGQRLPGEPAPRRDRWLQGVSVARSPARAPRHRLDRRAGGAGGGGTRRSRARGRPARRHPHRRLRRDRRRGAPAPGAARGAGGGGGDRGARAEHAGIHQLLGSRAADLLSGGRPRAADRRSPRRRVAERSARWHRREPRVRPEGRRERDGLDRHEMGITVSECLEYFADDRRTQAVALVVEGVRDGERFRRAAARLTEAGKPIVALKMGRSNTGRRNALTHTGALAGSHAAWQAVARQLGIVEVETFDDLVEVAGYLSRERRRRYRGVAVVATSGGASIMTADQLEARSIALPRLAPATVAALGGLLPDYAHTRDNPVDVTAGLSEALFGRVLETLVADPGADAVVAVVTGARGVERAENVSRVASESSKPLLTCWLGGSLTEDGRKLLDAREVPCFRNPRTLALALAGARGFEAARAAWRSRRPIETRGPAAVALPPRGALAYAGPADLAR